MVSRGSIGQDVSLIGKSKKIVDTETVALELVVFERDSIGWHPRNYAGDTEVEKTVKKGPA